MLVWAHAAIRCSEEVEWPMDQSLGTLQLSFHDE